MAPAGLSAVLRSRRTGIVASHSNGLQLQEVGDFEDENCLPPQNPNS